MSFTNISQRVSIIVKFGQQRTLVAQPAGVPVLVWRVESQNTDRECCVFRETQQK